MIDQGRLIRQAYDLQPFPGSVARLASLLTGEEWDIMEVLRTISLDQSLTLRLLGAANSAASASRRAITTIRDAFVRLGPGVVLTMAVASTVRNLMNRAIPEYGIVEGRLWRHSVAAALAAESAELFCHISVPPESYTASLLHDLGKLVLCRHVDADVRHLLEVRPDAQIETELEILGVHHGELGGLIAQHWGLPEILIRGITYHQNPHEVQFQGDDTICFVVCLADIVAETVGEGLLDIPSQIDRYRHVMDRLGISAVDFQLLCAEVTRRLEGVLSSFR
jgi:HD-like signal output (HDOD) protein